MKCPACAVELSKTDFRGINIEECDKCGGRWFDRKELQKLVEKADEDLRWIDFDAFRKDGKLVVAAESRGCPSCGRKMDTMNYKDSKVAIDICKSCMGVWLEKGETAKIIRYLKNLMWDKTSQEYSSELGNQFLDILKHPTHILDEIKDFFVVLKLLELRLMSEHPDLAKTVKAINENSPFK